MNLILNQCISIWRLFSTSERGGGLRRIRHNNNPMLVQPSLTEIYDTSRHLTYSFVIWDTSFPFFVPKVKISNYMTAFGQPFLLSPFDFEKLLKKEIEITCPRSRMNRLNDVTLSYTSMCTS